MGLVDVRMPGDLRFEMDLYGYPLVRMPSYMVKMVFGYGLFQIAYNLPNWLNWAYTKLNVILKSFKNEETLHTLDQPNYAKQYAVIYGACNNAGITYAKYFLEKGYGLVLIDNDDTGTRLDQLESTLTQAFSTQITLIKINSNKIDAEKVRNRISKSNVSNIKFFVNCKNKRRGKRSPQTFDQQELNEIKTFTAENITGFSVFLHFFLPTMLKGQPSIINVTNTLEDTEDELVRGHLFYYSSTIFSHFLTSKMKVAYPNLKTINVNSNFRTLKDGNRQRALTNSTFKYLGLVDEISV